MAGWNHDGCFKERLCDVCGIEFKPVSGAHRFCSDQCKGKWKYITGEGSTENQYKKISGNWDRYLPRLLNTHGRKRDGLTTDILKELLEEQDYKCALSGVELTCNLEKGTICLSNASVDRIEAGGPYTKDNIQLVCRAVNSFRMDKTIEEYIWWCKKVTEYNG